MSKLSDTHHFRKMIAGLCMVCAPLAALAAWVVAPDTGTDEAGIIATAAENADRWYLATLLGLVAVVALVPAVLGLMHMLREREVALGHIGGGFALLGLLAITGVLATDMVIWQMAAGGDQAEMTALLTRLGDTAGFVIPFAILPFAAALGLVVLALGLSRAQAVSWWMALLIAAAGVMLTIAMATASQPLGIVGAAFLLVGLGSIGRMVLMEPDTDWEHTPQFRGFRPAAGTH